jgi:hypothetical protein
MQNSKAITAILLSALAVAALTAATSNPAHAGGLACRKVVAGTASGEGRNALNASRARCADDEMLTGGACYPEIRPEEDGSCQTSAMAIIQTLADHPETTQGAFFTCLQTGGSDCAVEERTRAMAICCKIETEGAAGEKSDKPKADEKKTE